MKIYLTDQSAHFPEHLQRLKREPVMAYEVAALKEQSNSIVIRSSKDPDVLAAILFDYRIFPRQIMSHCCEWKVDGREIKAGDTIVQQIMIPPFGALSQKIVCGVRVKEVIMSSDRVGFSYETIEGHVEKGISTFTLERVGQQEVIFRIHTLSAPANLLARLLGPLFSRPYQAWCTRRALAYVQRQVRDTI